MTKVPYFSIIPVHGIGLVLATVGLVVFGDDGCGTSFVIGGGFIWLNWLVLALTWRQILGKKPIALSAGIIVIKYPLFALVLMRVTREPWFSLFWFAVGILTIIPASLMLIWKMKKT